MGFIEENEKERKSYVQKWANHVRTHSDKDWSKQQNIIINSSLKSASMTKEQFFKNEKRKKIIKFSWCI